MLLKIIKYDFRSVAVKMVTVFCVFALVCVLIPFFLKMLWPDFLKMYLAISVPIASIALCVLVLVFIFQHYSHNFYDSEGYLMFTLPVNGRELVFSKLLTAFVWITAAILLGVISGLVIILILQPFPMKDFGDAVKVIMGYTRTWLLFIVYYIVCSLGFILQVYFSITVSKLVIWRKFGGIAGIATFFAAGYIMSLPGLTESYSANIDNSPVAGFNMLCYAVAHSFTWQSQILPLLLSVVVAAALFISTSLLMEKQTSLK